MTTAVDIELCAFPESSDGAAGWEPPETSGEREGVEGDEQNDGDHEGIARCVADGLLCHST